MVSKFDRHLSVCYFRHGLLPFFLRIVRGDIGDLIITEALCSTRVFLVLVDSATLNAVKRVMFGHSVVDDVRWCHSSFF